MQISHHKLSCAIFQNAFIHYSVEHLEVCSGALQLEQKKLSLHQQTGSTMQQPLAICQQDLAKIWTGKAKDCSVHVVSDLFQACCPPAKATQQLSHVV